MDRFFSSIPGKGCCSSYVNFFIPDFALAGFGYKGYYINNSVTKSFFITLIIALLNL